MAEIIIYPEYQTLYDEVKELQDSLVKLLMERGELEYQICKNIEAEYMLKIGKLEVKLRVMLEGGLWKK